MDLEECFKQGLLKRIKPSTAMANKSIRIAEDYIRKARDNLKLRNYDITIIACYTAMFHAARALLFRDGVKEKSHICIIRYLQRHYRLGRLINVLDSYRRIRHTALYGLDILFKEEDANEAIEQAEGFLAHIIEKEVKK
jgi:uncharacterized protein (UPF0332 family)